MVCITLDLFSLRGGEAIFLHLPRGILLPGPIVVAISQKGMSHKCRPLGPAMKPIMYSIYGIFSAKRDVTPVFSRFQNFGNLEV